MAISTHYKMHPVHTVALNFEYPLIFDACAIGGHKTFRHVLPYLLLVHVGELLANIFLPFSLVFFVAITPGFIEHLGFFQVWFSVA